MLHLPHDAPKHPQVAPQDRGLVHQTHGVGDAFRLHQNVAKRFLIDGVFTVSGVHQLAGVVERAQRSRRQAFNADGGLVDQKGFQNRMGITLVHIVTAHINHSRFFIKVVIDTAQGIG